MSEQVGHTPGPWITDGDNDDPRDIVDQGGKLISCAYGNDRLIAAAPEFLEACKYILSHIADHERRHSDLYPAFGLNATRAIDMLTAAIAKAEGLS